MCSLKHQYAHVEIDPPCILQSVDVSLWIPCGRVMKFFRKSFSSWDVKVSKFLGKETTKMVSLSLLERIWLLPCALLLQFMLNGTDRTQGMKSWTCTATKQVN